ncbi:MAG: glycosyltransferase 87 family protein, partial [Dehalococcoidia bacterium]
MTSMPLNSSRWYAGRNFHLFVLAAVFLLAAFIRFWAAPISAGPDIAQFWAFADVFHNHGLDFYQYADAKDGTFPFWGWGFVYPPIWLLILGISLLIAPSSAASSQMIDESWRLAMKTPIITADLAIGALIYWAVPGSRWKKLLFACLWLFHPTSWYESAVFGQFDAIAAAFLLASVIMLGRGKDTWAFVFAGLALMTKQHTVLPIVLMLAVSARHMSVRRLISNCSVILTVVIFLSIPFLVTGNFSSYAESLFNPGRGVGYQEPLCYTFSGSSSVLTYLHDRYGWDTSGLMHFNIYVLIAAMLSAIILTRFRSLTPTQGALVGMLLFIGISYQVNYQYLVILIPLAILAAAQAVH